MSLGRNARAGTDALEGLFDCGGADTLRMASVSASTLLASRLSGAWLAAISVSHAIIRCLCLSLASAIEARTIPPSTLPLSARTSSSPVRGGK